MGARFVKDVKQGKHWRTDMGTDKGTILRLEREAKEWEIENGLREDK